MLKSLYTRLWIICMCMLVGAVIPAKAATYYGQVTATAAGAEGGGLVSATTSNTAGTFAAEQSASTSKTGYLSSASVTLYVHAQASTDAIFKGWFTNAECTGTATSTNNPYKVSVKATSTSSGSPTTAHYWAKFTYKYYSTVNAEAAGETTGGTVAVSNTDTPGTYSATATNAHSGDDSTAAGETHTHHLFAKAALGYYFDGWYADAACTGTPVSSDEHFTVEITTTATNSGVAPTQTYYAKFVEIQRTDYTFTIKANPDHITSIEGGELGFEFSEFNFSADGTTNVSNATPNLTLVITPASNVIYTVKAYTAGNALIGTYVTDAVGQQTVTIPSDELDGASIVVETREGWYLTVKGNPEVTPSITVNGVAYPYSVDGSRTEVALTGELTVTFTAKNEDVISSLRFYNAAGELVSQPLNQESGLELTGTIDAELIMNGRIEVDAAELGAGVNYLILKANPDHFVSIMGGVGTSATNANYQPLNYSADGSINIYPTLTGSEKFYYKVTPQSNIGVEYTIIYNYTDGTAPYAAWNNRIVETNSNFPTAAKINGGVVDIQSWILYPEGQEWSFTVKADPSLMNLRDYSNKITTTDYQSVECSLEGTLYYPGKQHSQIQLQQKDATPRTYNAYFYLAGADITNPDEAFMKKEGLNAKNATSWLSPMERAIGNSVGDGGTLVIKYADKIGTGTVTIIIEGNASNLKVTNGGGENDASNNITGLITGTNEGIALQQAYLTFQHKNGTQMPIVQCNGRDMTGRKDTSNVWTYTNKYAEDGDVYYIKTDYDVVNYDVEIQVTGSGAENFIQQVTVDGTAVSWTAGTAQATLSVQNGKEILVQGDKLNYIVNSITVNDESKLVDYSVKHQVLGNSTICFDVTYIDRDKSFTFEIGSEAKGSYVTALGSAKNDITKTTTVAYCDNDNPIRFSSTCTNSAQERVGLWYVNDELVASGLDLTYSVNEGDRVKVTYVATSTAAQYTVKFMRPEGQTVWPAITKDGEAFQMPTLESTVVANNTTFAIKSTAEVRVVSVTNYGDAVEPNADGAYEVTITEENEGAYINIVAQARDKQLTVYTTGLDKASTCTVAAAGDPAVHAMANVELAADGSTTVNFCDADLPLSITLGINDEYAATHTHNVYHNDAPLASESGAYAAANLAHGDALHIIIDTKEYEEIGLNSVGLCTYVSRRNLSVPEDNEAVKAYIATEFADGVLSLTRVCGTIPAGTGLMLIGSANTLQQIMLADSQPMGAPRRVDSSDLANNLFVGAYKNTVIPGSDDETDIFTLGDAPIGAQFNAHSEEPVMTEQNQAYLAISKAQSPASGEFHQLTLDDGSDVVTGIENVSATAAVAVEGIYTINGVKVPTSDASHLAPGFYIINGIKCIVK